MHKKSARAMWLSGVVVGLAGCATAPPAAIGMSPAPMAAPAASPPASPSFVAAAGPRVQATCTTSGREIAAGLDVGQVLEVTCPPGCDKGDEVHGTIIYTGDSPVCRAGIHAGAIPPSGGTMSVSIDAARPAYRGSDRNGIQSKEHPNYPTSFAVLVAGAAPPAPFKPGDTVEAGCTFSARDLRAETGSTHVVTCPPGCSAGGVLMGTDLYSFDSSICRAAIHAGFATEKDGGTVKVTSDVGQRSYRGSTRHGVRSDNGASDMGSFRLAP